MRNSLAYMKVRKEERKELLHVLETDFSLQPTESFTVELMSIIKLVEEPRASGYLLMEVTACRGS